MSQITIHPPPNFSPLTTRIGTNKLNQVVYSRLDYILTNSDCIIDTEFVENMSDHIFFNLTLDLKHSSVRRVLGIDRNQINREISTFVNEDITSILAYVRDNMKLFRKVVIPKPLHSSSLNFQIVSNQKRLLSDWINDYLTFAKSVTNLRFSVFQGLAFRMLRSVTKYDQFHKRDGSIIKVIKDNNNQIITDSNMVSKSLISHLRQNDNRFSGRSYRVWNALPSLPELTTEELKRILSRVSPHKALTNFPIPDEYIQHLIESNQCSTMARL